MKVSQRLLLAVLMVSTLALDRALGWTYSSSTAVGACGNLNESGSSSDFTFTSIINKTNFASPGVSDVLKITFVMPTDTSTNADIIFAERFGNVKYYNAAAKTLTLMGTVTGVSNATEDGLVGVAVERPFKNRVYVVYCHAASSGTPNTRINGSYRLSRFTLNASTHAMDMGSEQIILDVPSARNRWHTSGGIEFDNDGNLYWAVGDNEMAFTGPGNTHDLRGGIIRIHPNNDGPGYSIPPGNLAEVWGNKFKSQGRTALAAKYADTSLVRPELFIKGTRNAYSISVDPYRQHVAYGQCGPDYGGTTEVHNNSRTPIFAGWPFWAGTTTVASSLMGSSQYGKNGAAEPDESTWASHLPGNKNNPVNNWTGTMAGAPGPGVDTLPSFSAPRFNYSRSCAMGSVIVRYDGRLKNPGKLPPQMDNVWLMGDYNKKALWAAKVDSNGVLLATPDPAQNIFTTGKGTADGINALVDLQQGPDGALYAVNNNCSGGSASGGTHYSDACTGVVRIQYKGAACSDPALYPRGGTTGIGKTAMIERGTVDWVQIGPRSFSVLAAGAHAIRILDVRGRVMASMQGEGQREYPLPERLASNALYFLEVKSNRGINIRQFLNP